MKIYSGQVAEIRMEPSGSAATIACPAHAVPAPGQYTLAAAQEDVLGAALFLAGGWQYGFQAAPPLPPGWEPGIPLVLRGPLGRGFHLPENLRRLALVAAGESLARLLPLAAAALEKEAAVTLYSDLPLPELPAALEAYPLEALNEALGWTEFLALEVTLEYVNSLNQWLGLSAGNQPPFPGQVLVHAPMPCAGLAECGVCAVRTRRGWKLACTDGPVFDLKDIMSKT